VLQNYTDNRVLEQFEQLASLWDEDTELQRASQHVHQVIEQGARAASTISWFDTSAIPDLTVSRIVHELLRCLIQDLLSEAEIHVVPVRSYAAKIPPELRNLNL
jgi:hypothetical protein